MIGPKCLSFPQFIRETLMLRKSCFVGVLVAFSSAALAQVPVEQLAKPPANATHYIIQSTGGKHRGR